MTTPFIDDDTVTRLLDGEIGAAEAPAGYSEVATLISILREPAEQSELAREGEIVAAVAAAVTQRSRHGRRSKQASVLGAAALAATLLGSGAAAAATGNLPSGLQTAVAHAASHVGISLPDSDGGGPRGTTGRGVPAGGLSHTDEVGLCTAFLAGGPAATGAKGQSAAFETLTAAHPDTTSYCQGVVGGAQGQHGAGPSGTPGDSGASHGNAPGAPPGQSGSAGQSTAPGQNGARGQSGSAPAGGQAPSTNAGGDGQAPGGASGTPAVTPTTLVPVPPLSTPAKGSSKKP